MLHRVQSARVKMSGAKLGVAHEGKNVRQGMGGNGFPRIILVPEGAVTRGQEDMAQAQ